MKMTCCALIVLCATLLSGCGSPGSPGSDSPDSENTTLSAYKITEVAARSSSDPQPFGTKVSAAMPWKQIYFDGVTYSGSSDPQYLSFDAETRLSTPVTEANADWASYPHASTSARLGTDGKDSIVSVVFYPDNTSFSAEYTGTVSLVVWNGGTPSVHTPKYADKTFTLHLCGWGGNYIKQLNNEISIASGDLTGDGKDEIGFCVGNRFIILDGGLSTVLVDEWATGNGKEDTDTTTMHPSRVAAGDITGDGKISFVTTYGSAKDASVGGYQIFSGSKPSLSDKGSFGSSGTPTLLYANVCLGDIDGDGCNEAIFAGRQDMTSNPCNVVALDWNVKTSAFSFLTGSYSIALDGAQWAYNPIPPLVAFRPGQKVEDADSFDVLLAWDNILVYDSTSGAFSKGYKGLSSIDRPVNTMTIAGDFNYDKQDELVSFSSAGGIGLEIYSLGAGNSFTRSTIPITVGNYMSLCPADIDGKSLVVQYLGSSVKYTDPQIVAVLASPPYYASTASFDSFGNAGTSFGQSVSSGYTDESSFTTSASMTVGAEGDCPLWSMLGKATVKYTLGASFSAGFSESTEVTTSHGYYTMAGRDAVLYSCIPYDVYSYKILSPVPADEEAALMTVSFPRDSQLVFMNRDEFNALPGNTLAVGSSVLTHTLGEPFSYPNISDVVNASNVKELGGLYDTKGTGAPVGDGTITTSGVSQSVSEIVTVGAGVSVNASVEYVALGAIFGADIGFAYDYNYSIESSKSTEIEGAVSGVPSGTSPFYYGIASYQLKDTTIQQNPFLVVTYWVEKQPQ